MSADEFHKHQAFVVAHHDDQSVVVTLDVEHHSVICCKARISVSLFDVRG